MSPRIQRRIVQEMIAHARRDDPIECCGLLSGSRGVIDALHAMSNEMASPSRFRIPAGELFSFFRSLREDSRQHLGIYHSHPQSAAWPSRRDVAEFHYPEVSYWIISLGSPKAEVACFGWKEDRFHPVSYEVVADPREQ